MPRKEFLDFDDTQFSFYERDSELGYGINSATGAEKDRALIEGEFTTSGSGQKVKLDYKEFSSLSDFAKELTSSLSAKGKGSYGAFKASASFSHSSFNSIKITEYSHCLLLKAFVINPQQTLKNPTLTTEALELAKNSPDDFLRQYGDEFVKVKVLGGSLYILFEFHSRNSAEINQSKTAAKAIGSYFAASGSARYSRDEIQSTLKQNTEKDVWIIREGGVKHIPELTVDQLDKYARGEFLDDIRSNPVVLGIYAKPFAEEFALETKNVDFNKLQEQKEHLDELFKSELEIQQQVNNAQYVHDNIELFDVELIKQGLKISSSEDDERIKESIKKYIEKGNDLIESIQKKQSKCARDFNSCETFSYEFPNFKFKRKEGVTRPPTEKEVDILSYHDGLFGAAKITELGYCGYREEKYIAFRGDFRCPENGIYLTFTELPPSDPPVNIARHGLKQVKIENGEKIAWLQGSYAYVESPPGCRGKKIKAVIF